ncbi:MAG: CoA transferase [Deltaproteobacteria bacterium]|nr:CoA transferase [Deltaproteobacteria bacterium]
MSNSGPLQGIKIVDCTHILSGAFASTLLGDLGADVIKVEKLGVGDPIRSSGPPFQNGEGAYFFSVNRNKRSICVDLKSPTGIEIIHKLVSQSDVFMENFRPGVMDRLGLGYDALKAINPDLIYSSLTAFGTNGPYKDKPGFELIIQSLTGLVDVTSPPGGAPAKIQVQLVDLCAGMILAYSTLAALYYKLNSGKGQRVETSLLESTLAMLANLAGIYFMTGNVPTGLGTRNPQAMPSQALKTKDSHVSVVTASNHWERFCNALGRPDWIQDPELKQASYRVEHYNEVESMIETVTTTKTTAEWLEIFEAFEIAAAPINTIEQAFEDPGILATDMVKTMEHPTAGMIKVLNKPWKMSESPGDEQLPPPPLGWHTFEALKEAGYAEEDIISLKNKGVIDGKSPTIK